MQGIQQSMQYYIYFFHQDDDASDKQIKHMRGYSGLSDVLASGRVSVNRVPSPGVLAAWIVPP
jgi:hypothetical protein